MTTSEKFQSSVQYFVNSFKSLPEKEERWVIGSFGISDIKKLRITLMRLEKTLIVHRLFQDSVGNNLLCVTQTYDCTKKLENAAALPVWEGLKDLNFSTVLDFIENKYIEHEWQIKPTYEQLRKERISA